MELTAKLIQVLPPVTGNGKNGEWKRQNIILETDGMYPKKVCITIWGDKISDDLLKENTMLTISFDIESREFNNNWYTDLRAWKIEPADATNNMPPVADVKGATPPPPVDFGGESDDDLPF